MGWPNLGNQVLWPAFVVTTKSIFVTVWLARSWFRHTVFLSMFSTVTANVSPWPWLCLGHFCQSWIVQQSESYCMSQPLGHSFESRALTQLEHSSRIAVDTQWYHGTFSWSFLLQGRKNTKWKTYFGITDTQKKKKYSSDLFFLIFIPRYI